MFLIELINETQIMLYFPKIFKFNVFEFNEEPNVLDLSFTLLSFNKVGVISIPMMRK